MKQDPADGQDWEIMDSYQGFGAYQDEGGLRQGDRLRALGSPKKTFKKLKLEVSEDEIEFQWN